MKKAFVTGGTGFLGLNLIDELLKTERYEIFALHRSTSNLSELKKRKITLIEGSLFDLPQLTKIIPKECDVIFHCAANTNTWKKHNFEQTRDNVLGTKNMVSAALATHAKRFVHTSSIAAFGHHDGMINEQTPSNAASSWVNYVRTKFLAEQEVKRGIDQGLAAVFVNPANIVGPYDNHNWSTMIKLTVTGKLPAVPPGRGSFCHVREVAKALINAGEKGEIGEHYLLGGCDASYLDFVQTVAQLIGKNQKFKIMPLPFLKIYAYLSAFGGFITGKPPQLTPELATLTSAKMCCESQKARRALGYREVPLKEMVQDCLEWMQRTGRISV